MKIRITADCNNKLAKEFAKIFNLTYFSRSTGFNIFDPVQRSKFVDVTENYDFTINLTNGGNFSAVNLLCEIEEHCNTNQIDHKVFNIGSYICFGLIHAPQSKYPVEKAALKFAHERIVNSFIYHRGYLDSYLLNLNFIKGMSHNIEKNYKHLTLLSLDSIRKNVEFMLKHPNIKELSLQSKQPGNHRVNNGVGPLFPGAF